MKFSKSERALHSNNYNPPCNVYQADASLVSQKILTGSLAGPSFMNRNTFGYELRFQRNQSSVPGPGSYQSLQSKLNLNPKINRTKVTKGIQNGLLQTPPSIPYSYYGQHSDQEQIRYMKQLLLMENVLEASKSIKKKQPSFSFSKSEKKHSYLPREQNKPETHTSENKINLIEIEQQKKNSLYWHEKVKRANEKRLNFIQSVDTQFVPSLEMIQLINKKREKPAPGPGEYLKNQENMKVNYHLHENPKGAVFSSVKRFEEDRMDIVGPGAYHPKNLSSIQKFSFPKSSRNPFEVKDQSNFRFYINQNVQPSQKVSHSPFGSNSTRFPQVINNEGNPLTLQEEIKRNQSKKLKKMIDNRLRIQRKRSEGEKDQGLLGISTMASTIQ